MTQCAAFGCNNKGVHMFPKDSKRKKMWERALKRKNWKSTKYSRLCSAHFKPEDYFGKSAYSIRSEPAAKFLKKTAIPSIFSFTLPETQSAIERRERHEKRTRTKLFRSKETPGTSALPVKATTTDNINNLTKNEANTFLEKGVQVNFDHVYGCINRFKNDDATLAFNHTKNSIWFILL